MYKDQLLNACYEVLVKVKPKIELISPKDTVIKPPKDRAKQFVITIFGEVFPEILRTAGRNVEASHFAVLKLLQIKEEISNKNSALSFILKNRPKDIYYASTNVQSVAGNYFHPKGLPIEVARAAGWVIQTLPDEEVLQIFNKIAQK